MTNMYDSIISQLSLAGSVCELNLTFLNYFHALGLFGNLHCNLNPLTLPIRQRSKDFYYPVSRKKNKTNNFINVGIKALCWS